ncbi:MAG: hypothetical protein J2P23_09385 [Microlunatus sp.]|nr:hypothetical protein [Microlunatus sp.]
MTVVPIDARTVLHHGGRWTSWRAGEREWLWQNPRVTAAQRAGVRPGAAFVDAGGAEECFPTVRGRPDHGDAWSRPWRGSTAAASVEVPGLGVLHRSVAAATALRLDYRIEGRSGTPFLHALHALLAVSQDAVLELPEARTMIVLDQPDPCRRWPSGLDRLGPDDGTAVCALVPDVGRAVIIDGADSLELEWSCPQAPDRCSLLLWRNLAGWPEDAPYRSIGIEPMVGRAADVSAADPGDCARIGGSGSLSWSLRVRARSG